VKLSPLNLSGLRARITGDIPEADPNKRIRYACPSCAAWYAEMRDAQTCCEVEPTVTYECARCASSHGDEEDARRCCATVMRADECPVCGQEMGDPFEAVDCCLWKDLGKESRDRIAAAVAGGSSWAEELRGAMS